MVRGWGMMSAGPGARVRVSGSAVVGVVVVVVVSVPVVRHFATSSARRGALSSSAARARAWFMECWARLWVQARRLAGEVSW